MEHERWQEWAETLHRWNLDGFTAALLEAFGPLTIVGAQLMYLGQPVLHAFFNPGSTTDVAHMLEDPHETQRFIQTLRSYES